MSEHGLYTYAVGMLRYDGGDAVSSFVHGYMVADSEDEVRGRAVSKAMDAKPNFSITDVGVLRVPDEHLRQALSPTPDKSPPDTPDQRGEA